MSMDTRHHVGSFFFTVRGYESSADEFDVLTGDEQPVVRYARGLGGLHVRSFMEDANLAVHAMAALVERLTATNELEEDV